jgi:hypothetical protein
MMQLRWATSSPLLTLFLCLSSGVAGAASPRHLLYQHGRIVQEQQSARPRHPQHGFYELEEILEAFRKRGFVVSGEIRPKSSSPSESADRLVAQVRRLLDTGVPGDRITVVGASMGAHISLRASARLQHPDVRFCFLGACRKESMRDVLAEEGKSPTGRLLFIREASDEQSAGCEPVGKEAASGDPPGSRELVIETGLRHGFLYRPLAEWLDPVVEWAKDSFPIAPLKER